MKKLILIVAILLYVASIVVINFFGLEAVPFEGITYVSEIQCDKAILRRGGNIEIEPQYEFGSTVPIFMFEFVPPEDGGTYTDEDESIITNPNTVELSCSVYPLNADSTSVRFEYDEVAAEGIIHFIEEKRTVVFLKPDAGITMTIIANDGSNVRTSLYICAYQN